MNDYVPKFTLEDFIEGNELNYQIYGALLTLQDGADNRYKLKVDIVHIFNEIYKMCHIIRQDKYPEQYFYNYWNDIRSRFLAYETSVVFSAVYIILSLEPKTESNLTLCLSRIKSKIDTAYYEVFEHILNNGKAYADNKTLPADFSFLKIQADKIQDLGERELFYQEYATRYKQAQNQGDILKQIEDEINFIERTKELSNTQPEETPEKDNPNVAPIKVRSVVILEMLKQMQLGKAHNDLSKICKLIAFLTGNSYNSIYNELQKGVLFSKTHSQHIDEANKILSELNASISIDKNNEY